MIYLFKIVSNEKDDFCIEIEIGSDEKLLRLHEVIQNGCEYEHSQQASFFLTDDEWDTTKELMLIEDDRVLSGNNLRLCDVVNKKYDKLLYIFDEFNGRALFIELKSIKDINCQNSGTITLCKGKPPGILFEETLPEQDLMLDSSYGELSDINEIYGDFDDIY